MDLKEPITTQERLNEILKERLERVKEQVRSEFKDYDELKAKAAQLDELKTSSQTELGKLNDEVSKLKDDIANRDKADELNAIKTKVAKETGVPVELIQGDTEETMTAFAQSVAEFAKKPSAPNLNESGRSAQGSAAKTPADEFAEFFTSSFGN